MIAMAAVQAVTTFLPVGLTAHRLAITTLLGWSVLTTPETLAVYVGLLLAVGAYFWRDMAAITVGVGQIIRGRRETEARLLLFLIVAAIPLGVVGFVIRDTPLASFTSLTAIGWVHMIFGVILYFSDHIGVTVRRISHMTWSAALAIGVAQILALVPGIGRCAIAVTISRLLGFERIETARFALLLALPTLLGTIALTSFDLVKLGAAQFDADAAIAGLTAFAVGLLTIALMMSWLKRKSFAPFAFYRMIAGAALLGWIYFG